MLNSTIGLNHFVQKRPYSPQKNKFYRSNHNKNGAKSIAYINVTIGVNLNFFKTQVWLNNYIY